MSETLPTDALPKLGNDVFYDIRVLSAKVNSLFITAKDSPEKAEELYLSVLTTVCVYVENYLASHFSGLNSEYFERFCYSNIYGAEHRFTSLKKLAELSAYTLNSVPQNMCDKNADIASAANRVFKPSKRERLLLWELCGGNPEETAEKELSFIYIARKNQSAASPKKYIRLSAWSFYTSIFSLLLVNLSGAFILLTVFSFLMSIMLAALYAVKSLSSHRKERNYREKNIR